MGWVMKGVRRDCGMMPRRFECDNRRDRANIAFPHTGSTASGTSRHREAFAIVRCSQFQSTVTQSLTGLGFKLTVDGSAYPQLDGVFGWPISSTRPAVDSEDEMHYTIEAEQETDGRWLAEVPELPGLLDRIVRHTGLKPEDLSRDGQPSLFVEPNLPNIAIRRKPLKPLDCVTRLTGELR